MKEFIEKFTDIKIFDETRQIGRKTFFVPPQLRNLDIEMEPYSIGTFLGETKKTFKPSISMIDIISKHSISKVFVNKDAEWLFLCGRDIQGQSIVKADTKKGLALIQNERDENLGYGKFATGLARDDRIVIKNILDKGDFLRREQKSSPSRDTKGKS